MHTCFESMSQVVGYYAWAQPCYLKAFIAQQVQRNKNASKIIYTHSHMNIDLVLQWRERERESVWLDTWTNMCDGKTCTLRAIEYSMGGRRAMRLLALNRKPEWKR